jgi:methionyl-tRNA formyltransferase
MIITILSDSDSWLNDFLGPLVQALRGQGHSTCRVHRPSDIPEGTLAFFLGCGQLVPEPILRRNRHNLVVHESALPAGRGWSPLTWQILEGKNEIPVTLLEAEGAVDSGKIYLRETMRFTGCELVDELRRTQAGTTITMCLDFVARYPGITEQGREQTGEASYYQRRSPASSKLDIDKTIAEQFNLLRVVDNERYPAYFSCAGETFLVSIKKAPKGFCE